MATAKKQTAQTSDLVLPQEFFLCSTKVLARKLLGTRLVHIDRGVRRSGIIVETEAYLGEEDPASHSFGGKRTERTRAMYLEGGHSYVYFVYGMHFCFNVVARGAGEAVLVRALEPEIACKTATNGPAKLCKALGIDRAEDGKPLFRGSETTIFIEAAARPGKKEVVVTRPRVGVDYAGDAALWPLRYYWADHAHVSKK